MPGVQITPSNAPAATGPGDRINANAAPAVQPTTATTYHPESRVVDTFDPMQGSLAVRAAATDAAKAVRQDDQQEFLKEQQRLKLVAQDAMNKRTADTRIEVARMAATAKASGAAGKAMTGTTAAGIFERWARGLLEDNHGDKAAALEFLETESGKKAIAELNELGGGAKFTPAYITSAFGKYSSDKTKSENVDRRQNVRIGADIVKNTPKGTTEEKTARAGAIVKGLNTEMTTALGDTVATPTKADITDDEAAAAVTAGAKTDADVIKWVHGQRNKAKQAKGKKP
jgi:hypothetical protein